MKLSKHFIEFSPLLDRTLESICIDHNRKPVVGLNSQGGYTDRKEILELKEKKIRVKSIEEFLLLWVHTPRPPHTHTHTQQRGKQKAGGT